MRRWLARFPRRLWVLIHRNRLDRDLADELQFHREMLEQEYAGTPVDARSASARRLGNTTLLKETSRELFTFVWFETLWRDLRYGARSLRRAPVMAITSILSLALGIGAATTIYSLIDTLLLHAISAREPQTVVRFSGLSYPDSRDVAAAHVFEDLASYDVDALNWRDGDRTHRVFAQLAGPAFFDVLGVEAVVGRVFHRAEAEPERQARLAVLSYRFWQRHYNGNPGIVGRTLTLNGSTYTILGVLPRSYRSVMSLGIAPEIYVPMSPALSPRMLDRRRGMYRTLARLRPGRTREQTRDEFYAVLAHLRQIYPEEHLRMLQRPVIESITNADWLRSIPEGQPILAFASIALAASLLVTFIACANVGGLLLARTAARPREVAIRLSIGASRRRLVQQMLVESALVAGAGIVGALAITNTAAFLLQNVPVVILPVPIEFAFSMDRRLLLVAASLGFAATLLSGLPAAFQGTRTALTTLVKQGAGSGFRHLRMRTILVAGQFAVSMTLLAACFLFLRSFAHMLSTDPGFDVDHIVTLDFQPANNRLNRDQTHRQLLARLRAVPGIAAAADVSYLPLSFETGGQRIRLGKQEQDFEVGTQWIGPGYLATLQIPILAGREFQESDLADSGRHPIVVNQAFVDRYLGSRNPLGQRVIHSNPRAPEYSMEIVGVAQTTKFRSLGEAPQPLIYNPEQSLLFVVRAVGPAGGILSAVSQIASQTDPAAAASVKLLRTHVDASTWPVRFGAATLGMFAALGLLLAAVGLYGSLAYAVARRTVEIGIRLALGARQRQILWMVAREGLRILLAGGVVGMALASFSLHPLANLLADGLTPRDPLAFLGVVLVLAAAGLAASLLPAFRAVHVDPNIALRNE